MLLKLNRILFWIFLILFLGVIFFVGSAFLIPPEVIKIAPPPHQTIAPIEKKEVTIILVGDIMLDRGVKLVIEKYGDGDFKFPFLKIADYLNEVDVIFGNLEGPISNKGTKVGSIYSFRADPKVIEGLTFAGFNVLSLANNHAFDYGREALENTFLRLKEEGVDYVGAGFDEKEAYSPVIKDIKDTKIGFLAYTNLGPETWKALEDNSGIAWISENDFERVKNDIKTAKEKVDVLIVSLHAGEEYQKEPTQFQIDFAKTAIDAGADLVIGHHPHVIQPVEKYGDGYIAYSLGNFIFDQSFSEETMRGQMIKILIENGKPRPRFEKKWERGKIKEVIPMEIRINKYFQPEIQRLSDVDVRRQHERHFEEAVKIREQIDVLEKVMEHAKIFETPTVPQTSLWYYKKAEEKLTFFQNFDKVK